MSVDWSIQTQALTKNFPATTGWRQFVRRPGDQLTALDRVNLAVRKGEVFGLLGPNGAGKTTLIKILCTLILPSSGSAIVNGYPLRQEDQLKQTIGLATSDERSFYWRLTGRQNLEFFASLYGLNGTHKKERIDYVLEQVNFLGPADRRFQTYSSGMRQRLTIARALLNQPQLLFLDEPSKGLDPIATRQLHEFIRLELHERLGLTIFLTTHNLVEAQQLCDRIAVMDRGRILATGELSELHQKLNLSGLYTFSVKDMEPGQATALSASMPGTQVEWLDDRVQANIHVPADTSPDGFNQAIDWLRQHQVTIQSIQQRPASLEQIFSRLLETNQPDQFPETTHNPAHAEPAALRPTPAPDGVHFVKVLIAFLKRDFYNEASYRFAFFFQFFNVFFMVGVFYFIANLLGPAASPYLAAYGGDYFSFVLIGIAFSGYFGVGLSSFSGSIRQAQTTGTLEAMLSTPTSLSTIILSSALWDYCMTTLRVFVYLGVGAALQRVDLQQANLASAGLILLLTVIVFSSLGIIAAGFIMVLKRGDPVTWLFNAASSFLGGVYYPVAVLPASLQILAWLLPITYALEALRQALLNGAAIAQLSSQILALTVFGLVLLPASLIVFRLAVRQARTDGSLTHY